MKDDKILDVSDDTRRAVEPIYREFYQQVFNYVKSVVKNHHEAEDVVVDVFAKIMNLYGKPETRFNEEKSALGSWVRTVTNSVVLDYFKTNHQDRYKAVSTFVDGDGQATFQFHGFFDSPQIIMENDELKAKLLKAFRGLKPKYRKIATMYFIKEYEYTEISEMLDVPMGTVKGMISRARTMLQEELDGMYVTKKEAQTA